MPCMLGYFSSQPSGRGAMVPASTKVWYSMALKLSQQTVSGSVPAVMFVRVLLS